MRNVFDLEDLCRLRINQIMYLEYGAFLVISLLDLPKPMMRFMISHLNSIFRELKIAVDN
jgi:hypothetical protein